MERGELYEQDFLRWTEEQAAALRRARDSNLPLDWDNLAEEIESLGKSQRKELRSQIRRILHHLFKIEASPVAEPRAGWHESVEDARAQIADLFRDSPSLRRETEAIIAEQTPIAAKYAAADLERHGEAADAVWARLERGGFIADQVLGDWFPDTAAR
ncbi:MAG: DUF29 domain-containing protein [Stellaceae bacterium]